MNLMLRSEKLPEAYTPLQWRRELLYFAVVGMEAPWIILWYFIIQPGADQLPALATIAFVLANLIGAVLIVRLLLRRDFPENWLRWIILIGVGIGVLFAALVLYPLNGVGNTRPYIAQAAHWLPLPPYPVITGALVVGLWVRGLQIAGDIITPVRTSFAFRLGILMMIIAAAIGDPHIRNMAVALLPLFFYTGLLATSLARLASLRVNRTVQRASFSTQWIGFSGLIAAVIGGIGFFVALMLAGLGLSGVSQIMQSIFGLVSSVLLTLLSPILQLLEKIIDAISQTLAHAFGTVVLPTFGPESPNIKVDPQTAAANAAKVALISNAINLFLLGGLIALAIFILLRMRRRRDRDRMVEGEDREIMEGEGLLASLGNAVRDSLMGLQGLADLFGQRRLLNAYSIRRLYARLIARAANLGYPRSATETPYEYEQQLQTAFPGFDSEVALVTRAYVNVHYGELPDSADTLTAVKTAVESMLASSEQNQQKQ